MNHGLLIVWALLLATRSLLAWPTNSLCLSAGSEPFGSSPGGVVSPVLRQRRAQAFKHITAAVAAVPFLHLDELLCLRVPQVLPSQLGLCRATHHMQLARVTGDGPAFLLAHVVCTAVAAIHGAGRGSLPSAALTF